MAKGWVDWSPAQNLVAAPFKWDAPLQSGTTSTYGPGEATAIYLINPANAASQQLTVPHTDVVNGGAFFGQTIFWAEGDYAPKFSPDGTQLVFDLGQRATSSESPLQAVQPTTDGLYLVGVDAVIPTSCARHRPPPPVSAGSRSSPDCSTTSLPGRKLAREVTVSSVVSSLAAPAPSNYCCASSDPTLAGFGVQGALADPTLELHHADAQGHDTVLATNDNWTQTLSAAVQASGKAPPRPTEAGILANLTPGSYNAILLGKNNTIGVALVEAYDLSPGTVSQLSNISSRGLVGTGNNVIAGFIGGANTKVLVRALGPTLTRFGVPGVLADPVLTLTDANGMTMHPTIIGSRARKRSRFRPPGRLRQRSGARHHRSPNCGEYHCHRQR